MPRPPPAPEAAPSGPLSPAQIRAITPQVEVWRAGSGAPQRPVRRQQRMAPAYVVGDQPVLVRLQFDPSAVGKVVGVTVANRTAVVSEAVLRVRPTGECVVSLQLDQGALRGHVTFLCEGIYTTLPLIRSSLELVAAKEIADGGGR
jgi:hypothetical protein